VRTAPDSEFSEVYTNSLTITVNAPKVNLETGIRDIKTIWRIPVTFGEILPFLLMALGLALLTLAGIYLYRKWKNKEPLFIFAPKPVIPAHVEALENLEKLRLKQLWQNNLVKEFYTELTDILRIYIEKELRIHAVEMTSDELMDAIEDSELQNKSELLKLLRNTLPTADLVKFAKSVPLADEHDRCFKDVKQFVEETMPKAEEVAQTIEEAAPKVEETTPKEEKVEEEKQDEKPIESPVENQEEKEEVNP
jgi:LPXTG-motif cell wall-anchored protein